MSSFFRSRRPFRLTKGGWIFILYSIGVGAGAINTGNNLLYLVFGLFLGLILASGVLSDLTLFGLEASPIAPLEGRVGEPLLFPFSIRNSKFWFPSLGIRFEARGTLNGKPISATAFCPAIRPRQSIDCVPVFFPSQRGQLLITEVVFSTRFPFGLLFKLWTRTLTINRETLVMPKLLEKEPEIPLSIALAGLADTQAMRRGEGPTLFGVREFQPSDNPRRIHWKASAKRAGAWLVREMEEEEAETARLRWPDPLPAVPSDELEAFVSYVATLVQILENRRRRVALVGGESGRGWKIEGDQIGRFLALVSPDHRPDYSAPAINVDSSTDLFAEFSLARRNEAA